MPPDLLAGMEGEWNERKKEGGRELEKSEGKGFVGPMSNRFLHAPYCFLFSPVGPTR